MTPAGMIRDIRAGGWFGLLSHGVAYSDTGANKDTSQWMVSMLHQPAPDGELRWLRSGDSVDVLRGTSGRFLLEVGSVFRGSSQVFVHLRRPDNQAPRAYQLGPGDYFWLNRDTITAAVSRVGPLMVTAKVSEGELCGPVHFADKQDSMDAIWNSVRSPLAGLNLKL